MLYDYGAVYSCEVGAFVLFCNGGLVCVKFVVILSY